MFRINGEQYQGSGAHTFRVSLNNPEEYRLGLDFFLSRGYSPNVRKIYGIRIGYFLVAGERHWLKAGVSCGRLQLSRTIQETEIGGLQQDRLHETVLPFLEYTFLASDLIAIDLQARYNLMHSDNGTVVERRDLEEGGFVLLIKRNTKTYSAGFQFGIGITLNIFRKPRE